MLFERLHNSDDSRGMMDAINELMDAVERFYDVDVVLEYLTQYNFKEWGPIDYAKPGDAGFDLRAAINKPVKLYTGETKLIPTGIKVQLPEGYEMQIRPRSGLAAKSSISIVNSPGTIDSGYRGEIGVILINLSKTDMFEVNPGDRIAQGVICRLPSARLSKGKVNDSDRGEGGFGSTGVK